MDILAYALAKAAASGDISGLEHDVDELSTNLGTLDSSVSTLSDNVAIIDADKDLAVRLLINAFRQHLMSSLVCEEGTVTLTNSLAAPFNNSQTTISLTNVQPDTSYAVIAEFTTPVPGNAGEIIVSDRLTNGFKLAYTGAATSATIHYIVIGGII